MYEDLNKDLEKLGEKIFNSNFVPLMNTLIDNQRTLFLKTLWKITHENPRIGLELMEVLFRSRMKELQKKRKLPEDLEEQIRKILNSD